MMQVETAKADGRHTTVHFQKLVDPWLIFIVALSLIFNLWGVSSIQWWHPDEMTTSVVRMVSERTIIPPVLAWGSFHYYVLMVFVVPSGMFAKFFVADPEIQRAIVMSAGRLPSALMGAGCAGAAFVIGDVLFNRATGLLAALLTALSVGLVLHAHFATATMPGAFWFAASLAMSALFLSTGSSRQLMVAGLFAGLAAATKYVDGVVLLGALVALFLAPEQPRRWIRLWQCCGAAALAFLVGNPAILASSCVFLEAFLVENRFNQLRNLEGSLAFLPLIHDVSRALGWGTFGAGVAGGVWAVVLIAKGREWRALLVMLVPGVVYYLVLGSHHVSQFQYAVPLVPIFAVLAAKLIVDLAASALPVLASAGWLGGITVALISTGFVLDALLQISNDSRLLAGAWIVRNVPAGSTIEVTSYSPRLPRGVYQLSDRPHDSGLAPVMLALEKDNTYQTLKNFLTSYFNFSERVGVCNGNRPYYRNWFGKSQGRRSDQLKSFGIGIADLKMRAPSYVVISSFYYNRFGENPELPESEFFRELIQGISTYPKIAQFHYKSQWWFVLNREYELVNPVVMIFQRETI